MRYFLSAFILILAMRVCAQDDLLKELESNENKDTLTYIIQTFKGTRLVNGHSTETKQNGTLEFIISHRFGYLNSGSYNLFGLDESTIRIGLEYGFTDRFGVGVGRSSWDKTFDGYLKYKLLRQSSGTGSFPFTLTLLGSGYIETNRFSPELHGNDRLAFAGQLLMARKFSQGFSFQVAPLFLHRNAVDQTNSVNDLMAVGVGGRIRITRSMSLHAEYYARLNEKANNPYKSPVGVAFDIETGGHVFQLVFTNTVGMMERMMLTETTGDFLGGDIRFGFNITRTFQLKVDR